MAEAQLQQQQQGVGKHGGSVALAAASWHWWRRWEQRQHGEQCGGGRGGEGCTSHVLKIYFFIPFFKCSIANILCRVLYIYLVVHSVVFLSNTGMVLLVKLCVELICFT